MGKRVIVAEFKHETNTFCSTTTTMKDFEARYLKFEEEVVPFFRGRRMEMGGFIDACEQEDIEIIPSVSGNATPGGIVSREVFEVFLEKIKNTITREAGKIDGLLLSLHGAMVIEDHLDGEGALLSRIRKLTGPSIPVICTLDLHANLSEEMVDHADVLFPYESYPHVDQYERAHEAGLCMARFLKGGIRPVARMKQLPILASALETSKDPIKRLMKRVHEYKSDPRVLNAAILHGFCWADTPFTGVSVMAVTDGDALLAEKIVEDLGNAVLGMQEEFLKKYTPVEEAIREAMDAPAGPVILADLSDNPGGGGPADSTHILAKLIELKARNVGVAIITDPEVVDQAIGAGVGNMVEVRLGGKVEAEEICGSPVNVVARVKTITDGVFVNKGPMAKGLKNDIGRTVVLEIDGIEVIVPERRIQPWDPEIFRRMGIDPAEKKVLVLKSSLHFRAAYGEMAKKIIEVGSPGLLSSDFSDFRYKNLKRPIFPLDKGTRPDLQ